MFTLIKWVLGILFALALLVVAAALVLPFVINPNDYKQEVIQLVKKQTGRDIALPQDLQLSVFPWLGIQTGQVVLGNAPGFGEQPFAQIQALGLQIKLLPLLQQQIEIDTLVLDGLQLNLAKNATGLTNWADLQKQPTQQGTTSSATDTAEQPQAGTGATPISFSVQSIQIRDAQITWQDQQTGQAYQLSQFNLTTGGLFPGTQSPIQADFSINSTQPAFDAAFRIEAELEMAEDLTRFGLNDLNIVLDTQGLPKPEAKLAFNLVAQASLDLQQDMLSLKQLKLTGPEMALTADVAVNQLQGAPAIQAGVQLQDTNLKQLAALFGVAIETQKADALTHFSADMQLKQQGTVIKLEPLAIKLDQSTLRGHLHLLDATGPSIRTVLQIDQINLDHYLPPAAKEAQGQATGTGSQQEKTAPKTASANPLAPLRTLDLQAELRIGKLVANKMHVQNIVVKAVNKAGILQLNPLSANLYQGTFQGNVTLNTQQQSPKLHAVKKLTGVQIGGLLADLMGEESLVGSANMDLDAHTTGLTPVEMRNSLTGNAKFRLADGAYKGINIAQLIRETGSALGLNTGKYLATGSEQTDFSELTGSLTMQNGLIRNPDLSVKSPLLRINGEGQVNLPKDNVDYLLTTELVSSLEGQGGGGVDDLSGFPIPVRISGPLQNLSYRPELKALISKKAEQRIKQEAKKVQQKVEQKIQDEVQKELEGVDVKGVLRGLFGR